MRYNVNDNNLPIILDNIKKEFDKSKETIGELLKIDHKHTKIETSFEQLTNIIETLKKEKLDTQKNRIY